MPGKVEISLTAAEVATLYVLVVAGATYLLGESEVSDSFVAETDVVLSKCRAAIDAVNKK
jgi:hypothetical protein